MLSHDTLIRLRALLASQVISASEPNLVEVAQLIAEGLAEIDAEIEALEQAQRPTSTDTP